MDIKDKDGNLLASVESDECGKYDLRMRNLMGADLRGVDMSDSVFSGANLMGADLSEGCFSGCDFDGARLPKANLFDANMSSCNMARVDFRYAAMRKCYLDDSIMYDSNLNNADIRGARIENAWLVVGGMSHNGELIYATGRNDVDDLINVRVGSHSYYGITQASYAFGHRFAGRHQGLYISALDSIKSQAIGRGWKL